MTVAITRDDTAPDVVRDLRGEARGNSSVLSWKSPSDDDVKTYHVYRISGSSGTKLLSTRSTTATLVGFGPFAVTAEDKTGNETDLDDAPRITVGRDTGFDDVPREHGASAAIASLRDRGVVNGRTPGRFDPDGLVTRAEFAKMLAGTRGIAPEDGRTIFRDVPSRSSLAGYIAAVVNRGWATGQDGLFGPWRHVTRLEAARMIVRAAGLTPNTDESFSDVTDDDARGIVGALVRAGIAAGHDGRFDPDRPLTRAEAAIMLAALPAV